ncbi:MAG TPA: hypothetical protein VN610_08595 [Bryobacteraceae bacterium]|nr:hypothetical protein [Bryobacteraceae bacterium]
MISPVKRLGLLAVALACTALAKDPRLDALRLTVTSLRGKPPDSSAPRGVTPQLTVVKHQLRDWMESRLATLPERGDVGELERRLNSELREAGLFCGETNGPPCPGFALSDLLLGFLDDLKLRRSGVFLIAQTGVGIECGFDESAYVYGWSGEYWRRVWETEQDTYTEKAYRPQTIQSVLISPYNRANDYLVLTLGLRSWCSSGWQPVYYRAFRLGPDPLAPPLVDGDEFAYIAGDDPPIRGSVTVNDVLVEFPIRSIDTGVFARPAIRHYKIDHDNVKRVDPLALRPRDFMDEWLTHDWKESAFWSESANRRSMLDAHEKLHKGFISGDFIYPTMHCAEPDLWQVGVDFGDPAKGTYFLVRWRPPYHFTMVQVSDPASPDCTEEDSAADDEYRTLFPGQP